MKIKQETGITQSHGGHRFSKYPLFCWCSSWSIKQWEKLVIWETGSREGTWDWI